MMRKLQLLILLALAAGVSSVLGYAPPDNYLIDCGSSSDTSVNNRTFHADGFYSGVLSASQNILAATNSTPLPSSSGDDSTLLLTATIFTAVSHYTFPVGTKGRHLIRLHFCPFDSANYNLSQARFSVSAQNITLVRDLDFQLETGSVLKEYSFDVLSDRIVIVFTPSSSSFAFVNALEVFSLPSELIPDGADSIDTPQKTNVDLRDRALETTRRINMGSVVVLPRNDTLWRRWDSDAAFLRHNSTKFVENPSAVTYRSTGPTVDVAPPLVYGTGSMLDSDRDPTTNANITWLFRVDPGFEYLVRFHFCDIVNTTTGPFRFHVYLNSRYAYENLNLDNKGFGVPYYFDVITKLIDQEELSVSVGPLTDAGPYPMAILNGLEIMKIINSKRSLDLSDSVTTSSETLSRKKLLFVVLAAGVILVAVIVLLIFFVLRRNMRRKLAPVGHSKEEDDLENNDHCADMVIFSSSKIGYRFPLVAIEDATDKFSESLLIGVGGFGKVYKGVLRDGTVVAVKRGSAQSRQGLAEFRTEVEMLSQFRHRHLVSLIGYCDERNEMIIIYEFMENGTLKNHLYGSDLPVLSWKQRLEICIGSAKGLHYLHTGPTKAIIHRDVKSANILLDENFMAKVADFGLSKAGPDLNETHVSTAIKGSFGYLDPEYLTRQQLTEKSDVYSFGVVMLEVLSGRPVIDPSRPREEVNLVEWAMKRERIGKLHELVDPRLEGQMREESLSKFAELAAKCLAEQGAHRPPMGDVLWNLEFALQLEKEETAKPSQPRQFSSEIMSQAGRSEMNMLDSVHSIASVEDLAGVSMSKVFANMVKEDMR